MEPDMEQQTGSKLRKEFIKALYCHLAYLTYMQCAWVLSHFTHVQLFATLLTVACQLHCPWGLSRQEYWRIPWTEEPGGLQSIRSQRIRLSTDTCNRSHTHRFHIILFFSNPVRQVLYLSPLKKLRLRG